MQPRSIRPQPVSRRSHCALVSCVLFGLACLATSATAQWRSKLYPSTWTPGFKDAQGRFLHDFSYAGYHRGERAIPTSIPGPRVDVTGAPYRADNSGASDATKAIQDAIDAVGRAGGGVVFMPAGTYRLSYGKSGRSDAALWVHDDGVVLRGEGATKTKLFLDETVTRGKQLIRLSHSRGGHWYSASGTSITLATDLPNQSTIVPVPNTSSFSVGDWIVLRCDATSPWIAEHGMTGGWTSGIGGVVFYRQVVAKSAANGTITIDAPTRYPMKTRDNLRIYPVREPILEAGVEDLAIGMRQNPGTRFGDNDYTVSGTGAYEVHGSDGILFGHARNCWAQRVHSYRPTVNTKPIHLHSDGIVLGYAQHVTVKDCAISNPQYKGGGGNGYGYVLQGADCMFVDSTAFGTRHSWSFKSTRTTGNVLLRCRSTNARYPLDFHMHLSMSNLIDNATLDRDFIGATYRTSGTIVHGHATTQSVIWNTHGIAYGSKSYIVDSRQYGYGYVIGTRGNATRVVTTPTTVSGKQTAPVDWVEGVGQGATLEPASLYEDQFRRRRSVVAQYTTFGAGCSGASIINLAQLTPRLGTNFSALVTKPVGATASIAVLGFTKTSPVDLTPVGMNGCSLYFTWDLTAPMIPISATADMWTLPIPNDRRLLGARFYQQALIVSTGSNAVGLILTNAGEALIGEF